MCNFRVGQKVVAIKRELSDYEKKSKQLALKNGVSFPEHGTVYTVRAVFTTRRDDGLEVVAIHLVEIKNDPHMKFNTGRIGEIGFDATCFRPVVERGTEKGMSILRDILNKTDKPVEVAHE